MFDKLERLSLDPIYKLLDDYKADERKEKVNLGIGLYTDEEGNPFVLETIKRAWDRLDTNNFNYQPIGGNKDYLNLCAELVLGEDVNLENLALQSTCGSTQACSFLADLVDRASAQLKDILIPVPTWSNHFALFKDLNCLKFEHLDSEGEVNFREYESRIRSANPGSLLLLHGGLSHNPTGKNLSLDQLKSLIPILKERKILVFVDYAYLGLSEGFEKDREYAKLLFNELDNFALGFSFSKNASMYEHRLGCLMVKTQNKEAVETQLQQIARTTISMAPGIGQELMIDVLRNHKEEWLAELEQIRLSILKRKSLLLAVLPDKFAYLRETYGMFGLLDLRKEQILKLRKEKAIFMPENGRINFAGLVVDQIEYIGRSIAEI